MRIILEDFFDDLSDDIVLTDTLNTDTSSDMFLQFVYDIQLNSVTISLVKQNILSIKKFNSIINNLTFADNAELKFKYYISRRSKSKGNWKDYTECNIDELIELLPNLVTDKNIVDVQNGVFSNLIILFEFHFTPRLVSFDKFSDDMYKLNTYGFFKMPFDNIIRLYEDGKKIDSFKKDYLFKDIKQHELSSLYNRIFNTTGVNYSEKYAKYKEPYHNLTDYVVKKLIGVHNYPPVDSNYKLKLCGYSYSLEMFTANKVYDIVLELYPKSDEYKKVSEVVKYIKELVYMLNERASGSGLNRKFHIFIRVEDMNDFIFDTGNTSLINIDSDIDNILDFNITFVDDDGMRLRLGRIKALKQPKEYQKAIISIPKYRQYLK